MAGFEEWRWAAYRVRQALKPAAAAPTAVERFDPDPTESASTSARDRVTSSYESKITQNEERHNRAKTFRTRNLRSVVAAGAAKGIAGYLSVGGH